ncbi:MAG: translocation protein TolB [bacterium ADurb.Bin243]|nr:MAG: translocation protein TolB [bacterium ADurb.Bin243]
MVKKTKFIFAAALLFITLSFLSASAQTLTQTINLKPGFNFVCFTNVIALTPSQFKQLNASAIEDIYLYSAAAGSFLSLSEGSLTSLAAGKGYIVKNASAASATITVNGTALGALGNITLKTGFNLVGFSKAPQSAVRFSQLMNSYTAVRGIYKWNPAAGSFIQVVVNDGPVVLLDGTDPEFRSGESYFFNISSDTYINYDGASITMDQNAPVISGSVILSGALPAVSSSLTAAEISAGAEGAQRAISYATDFELLAIDLNTMNEIPAQISINGAGYSAKITASDSQNYSAMMVLRHKSSSKIVFSAIAGQLPLKSAMGNIEKISVSGIDINSESSAIAALTRDKKISPPQVSLKDNVSDIAAEAKSSVYSVVGETIAVEFKKAVTTFQAIATNSAVSAESRSALFARTDLTVKDVLGAYAESLKIPQAASIIPATPGAAASVVINQTTINESTAAADIETAAGNISKVIQPADIKTVIGTERAALVFPTHIAIKHSDMENSLSYNAVIWQSDSTPSYNKDSAGTYVFSGSIEGTSLRAFQRVILSAAAEAPVFSPGSTIFLKSCQVTITSATKDAVIRYTLDNSAPTASSALYSGPIELTQSAVIRAIATKTGLANSPAVSASYTRENISGMISFLSYRDSGIGEIYTVNADGSALTRLIQTDNHNGSPSLSPDGSKIVYSAAQVNTATLYGGAKINVMNSDGTNVKQLYYIDSTRAVDPSYSADGSRIVFVRHVNSSESRICVMNADGSGAADIYTMNPTGNSSIRAPKFSPDASKIIFTCEDSWSSKYELYIIGSDGSAKTLVADKAVNARFAPDGKILYCEYGAAANRGIIRCAQDGSGSEILIPYAKIWGADYFTAAASCAFDISPDGKHIAFAKNNEIYIIKSDASAEARQTTTIASAGSICWRAGQSGFNGRTPAEIKLCSDTGSLYDPPAEISGSFEKVLISTIYPLINIKVIAFFDNNILVNNTYQKMRQWVDPVWSVVSGAGKITGDLYKYFTAPSGAGDTIIKASYTEAGKEVTAQFTMSAITFNASGKLYFASNKDGYYEIYRCDYNGNGLAKLTNHKAYTHSPAVSPDGSKIAYVTGASSLNYEDREIYVMNSDGSGAIRLTNNALTNYSPSFSPDGKTVCYGEDGKIKIAAADGSGSASIVTGATDVSDTEPLFTSDGTKIIFSSSHKEGSWYVQDGTFIIGTTGGERVKISPSSLENACLTPDGKIAYVKTGKLYTMNTDGSGVTELLPSIESGAASFSPDGGFVIYEKAKNGVSDIWALASNGTGEKIRITNGNIGQLVTGKVAWGR